MAPNAAAPDGADLPEVTITLPQNVWQTVEDVLCAYQQDVLHHTTRADLERAIAALKGFESVEGVRGKHTSEPSSSYADESELIHASIEIYHQDDSWWLLITGELFGPYPTQDTTIDAIPNALRSLP